jgi:superfamily II DNA or RNA helicase
MDLEKQEIERIKAQEKAQQLSLEHKHLVLAWATGVGKGKAVMQCIAASPSSKKWLIVVPEIIQIANYKADMKKHGYEWLLGTKILDIICYASLKLYKSNSLNLALNEVHRVNDLRADVVNTIFYDQIISDSATIPESIAARLWEICPYWEYEITLNEAISLGILPPPTVYKVAVKLDENFKRNKYKVGKNVYLYTDFSYVKRLDGNYEYWKEKYEDKEKGGQQWQKMKMLRAATERKEFLASCKTKKARNLINSLLEQGKRFVVFCGSIEQANQLGNDRAVHSGNTKKQNQSIIDAFNRGEINSLYFYKMGKEGLNLFNIDAGLIIQLDSGFDEGLSFLQRIGRALRGKDPDIYVFYVPETQDEKYYNRAIKHIDKQYIKTYA